MVLTAVILLLIASGCSSSAGRLKIPPLPVIGQSVSVDPGHIADPFVLSFPKGVPGYDAQDKYLMFSTGLDTVNVDLSISSSYVAATNNGFIGGMEALPVLPTWASAYQANPPPAGVRSLGTWGPSVAALPGGWVLYFSTRTRFRQEECIGAAFSKLPAGPYTDRSAAPLVCQSRLGGSIDPDPVKLASGKMVLVWKSDGSHQIWEQSLTSDGMAVAGKQHLLIGASQRWEHGNVEGPDMFAASKDGWWLFYSGGQWNTNNYGTGVAWCRTVQGPCTEPRSSELLTSKPGAISPGGLSTFRAVNGSVWVAYSTFPEPLVAGRVSDRVLRVAPLLSF